MHSQSESSKSLVLINKNKFNVGDTRLLNNWLKKSLYFMGIKRKTKKKSLCSRIRNILHPFPIFFHLALLYNLAILLRNPNIVFSDESKTRVSSSLTSILSCVLYHAVRSRAHDIHVLLKKWHLIFLRDHFEMKTPLYSSEKLLFIAVYLCIFTPVIFAIFYSIKSDMNSPDYTKLWFFGYSLVEFRSWERLALFICVFSYINEQTFFPSIFLLLFCTLTLHLEVALQELKSVLRKNHTWQYSLFQQSERHKQILLHIRDHERILSFPVAFSLFFYIVIGYTGFALGISRFHEPQNQATFEALLYIYFSITGIISVTYTASRIPQHLQEIKILYQGMYENASENNLASMVYNENENVMHLKMICERPMLYLTAWGIFRLDKKLAFTSFGVLFTYGLLIMQMRKQSQD